MLVNSFNHFRAIAIIFIVAGHSFSVNGMKFDSVFDMTIRNLISGGTTLFVFISGFLFHYVFVNKYEYKRFVSNKIKNVLLPYIILGFVPVLLYVIKKPEGFDGYFLPAGTGLLEQYIIPVLKYYVSGAFLTAYWYIPFIMLVFFFSPLHVLYCGLKAKEQIIFIFLFSILSIVIHRPVLNVNVIHSFIYFTPVYLIGLTSSIYSSHIYEKLKGKELYILFIVLSLAIYQASIGVGGNYHKNALTYSGVDLMFFQKIALCFFFMIWLNRFEKYNNKFIHAVASTSFTAFFIHPFIIRFIPKLELSFIGVNSWFVYTAFVMSLVLVCILVAKAVRKVIPKYSRYVVGY